ncbi:MAG: hypothetical protein E7233_03660 [Lachnospiraceae bacterium]|nr:hypothetical protein [Lachnospiraceae bacterium]
MILTPKEKEKKKKYVEILRDAFTFDERSGVVDMRYEVIDMPDVYEENVKVFFEGGGLRRVNVTGDSCQGMYIDIGRAVYG